MLAIAKNFRSSMDRVANYVELSVATFDLAKTNLSKFRSTHVAASATRNVHAKVRTITSQGLSLACEGAFLSACAQFEQCVRDVIEEAANQAIVKKGEFTALPQKMQDHHITGCGNIIQNLSQDKFQHLSTVKIVTALHACVVPSTSPVTLVVEAFSNNERNFRPSIIAENLKRLGLIKAWELLGEEICIQDHFSTKSAKDAERFARERLERIMDKRNATIHRGKSFVAPSDAEVRECASYFTALIEGITSILTNYINSL